MKKFIIALSILFLIFMLHKENIVIPKEAIRVRIIASSNSKQDQKIKEDVKYNLDSKLYDIVKDAKNIDDARSIIKNNIPIIDTIVSNSLEKYDQDYKINFGYNYFPEKEYKGIKYPEGLYESVVITLGNGLGDNWWCVMFPPFCLLEAHENDTTNIEYRWRIKDMIDKYFK